MLARIGDLPWWQPDCATINLRLRPGNSGGPLVDAQGRLLGLNTVMNGPEVGMAVPVHVIRAFVHDALKGSGRQTPPAPDTDTPPAPRDSDEYI